MTNTQTFDEWYESFQRDYYLQRFPNQRYGQAFSNALYKAGRSTLANSLCYDLNDPWNLDYVPESVKDYCRRVWNFMVDKH